MNDATSSMNTENLSPGDEARRLRCYLLHQLPETDVETLEQQLLGDDALLPALQVAETDLIDAYAAGRLDGATRQAVERHLLATARDRERLRIARALQGQRQRRRRPFVRYLGGALLAAALAGIAVLLWPPALSWRSTPAAHSGAVTYTIALLDEVQRGAGATPEFTVPAQAVQIRLQLEVPATATVVGYRLSVLDAQGQTLYAASGLRLQQAGPYRYVECRLPARRFGHGLRQLRLSDEAGTPLADWTLISR